MATQNQNTTSKTSNSRPMKNDSSNKSWEEKVDDASGYKTERDSRGTISPSTSDDVSSLGASSTEVHEAPERKTQPDFDKTQDPQVDVYGSQSSPRAGESDDSELDAAADSDLEADADHDDSNFSSNTTSSNSSSPKDNIQH